MDDNDKNITGPKDGDQVFVTFRGTYKGFDEYQGTHRIMGHWDGSEHVFIQPLELQWSTTVTADETAWFRNEDPEGLEREREAVSAAHEVIEERKPMPEFTPEQAARIAAAPPSTPWKPPAQADESASEIVESWDRTPDQKRHDETLAALAEIRDRLPERPTLYTLEGVAAEFGVDLSDDEPAPVPPRPDSACVCGSVDDFHLPSCYEPADITEEPPAGSQVTDREGDVWEQVGAGWQVWDRTASMWGGRTGWGSSVGPRSHAPLRPTTDADRERVGLPVDPAPADVDPDITFPFRGGWLAEGRYAEGEEKALPLSAKVADPDESLAKVIMDAWRGEDTDDNYDIAKIAARAAREHIEKNQLYAYRPVAAERDKAVADLARVTKERDERTRDAIEWRNRLDALRHDVWVESGSRVAAVAAAAHGILARDTERAES